ncbi:MAG TPA: hypothetical protein VL400_09120 [Polyangiaceae bacterium]|nr:hypothetical protein [Polyangiaceae bacterium]
MRLAADAESRSDVLKSLRLLECQPNNRRPISIVDAPFATEAAYLAGIVAHVESDVAKVDAGLTEDGIHREAPPTRPLTLTLPSVLSHLDRLAGHVAQVLDGLVVVLAPKAVTDPRGFASVVRSLAAIPARPTALRLDVLAFDIPALETLLPVAVPFELDRDALFDYLRDLGPGSSAGPKEGDIPPMTPEQRATVERELGQPLLSCDAGQTLKRLLMDGGKALAGGTAKEAIRKYRAARILCEATGLARESIVVTLGLGTAYVASTNLAAAEAAYRQAVARAEAIAAPALSAQARFGLGAVLVMQSRWRDARGEYEAIAAAVTDESPLRKEALRMVQACERRDPLYGLDDGARA